jgi:hypothetical protein
VFGTCGRTWTRILDQVPAREVFVPAVIRITEHSFERQPARAIEECPARGESLGSISFDSSEHGVPLFVNKIGQRRAVHSASIRIHRFQTSYEHVLFVPKISGQLAVYVILCPRVHCARTVFIARNQPVNECFEGTKLRGRQGVL